MSTSSPFIRGIFFFLFLFNSQRVNPSEHKCSSGTLQNLLLPSALGVAGDVMLQAVLLYLQRVVEGAIQLLDRHLDGALRRQEEKLERDTPHSAARQPAPAAHHIFLGSRGRVVLADLQLQNVPLPVESKAAEKLHHAALISAQEESRLNRQEDLLGKKEHVQRFWKDTPTA